MNGLMMKFNLTVPAILKRAETLFGSREIVSQTPDKQFHRYTYRDLARRAKKLAVTHLMPGSEPRALEHAARRHFAGPLVVGSDLLEV